MMKKVSYFIQYLLLKLLQVSVNRLPSRAAIKFGADLGSLAYFLGLRKEVAANNLRNSFPLKKETEIWQIALSLYRNLGMNLSELLRFTKCDCRHIRRIVTLQGAEHLDQVLKKGKGAILVSAHYGNWELYAAALACYGYPFSVVVYPQHNQYVDAMLNDLRRAKGIEVIYKKNAAREVLLALRRNRFVTMLADQDAGSDGLFVDFMGHKASTTKGPAVFALKTGAPIITGAIVRQDDGLHRGYVNPPLYADQNNGKETEITWLTKAFTAQIEEYVRKKPDHWYWVHKRWKTKPPVN